MRPSVVMVISLGVLDEKEIDVLCRYHAVCDSFSFSMIGCYLL